MKTLIFQRFLGHTISALLSADTVTQLELEEDFSIQLVSVEVGKSNGLIFDDEGDVLACEKVGLVWRVKNGKKMPNPVVDIREEVMSSGDFGLVSVALDSKGFLCLFCTVDYHHLMHVGSATYRPYKSISSKATIGRVTKYKMEEDYAVVDSRQKLIGKDKEAFIPVLHSSHVGESLAFAGDGNLFLSIGVCSTCEGNYGGDGPPFYNAKVKQAIEDGIIREEEEVRTMRAQLVNSYSGKIILFDRETRLGYCSNPFYQEENPDSLQSKVWALGFRNPYCMTFRKGS